MDIVALEAASLNGLVIAQWVIRVVVAVPVILMGINHFRPGPGRVMAKMIPPSITGGSLDRGRQLVVFTGVCEVAGGIGLLIPGVQIAAAVALIVFFIAVFPANAYAAQHPDRFGKLAFPYWPRFAAQLVLIGLLGVTLVR